MADSIRLTPVSYVVLGLIAGDGPSTPYELKAAVARSVAKFWAFPHTQLYVEPERLAAAGLLEEERETEGRRRRVFSITPAGRQALQAWLEEPDFKRELRDLGLLKLFFSGVAKTPATVRELAEQQEKSHRSMLEELLRLEAEGREDGDPHRRAVLQMGLRYQRQSIDFWSEIAGGGLPDPADLASEG